MSLDILDILQIAPPFGGVAGAVVLPPPTTYTLAGPATGYVGFGATFTVTLGAGTLGTPVALTPHAIGVPGTLSPVAMILTDAVRSGTFTFTPSAAGSGTIGVTDDAGMTDPAPMSFTATVPADLGGTGGGPIVMLRPAVGPPPASAWRPGRGRRSRG